MSVAGAVRKRRIDPALLWIAGAFAASRLIVQARGVRRPEQEPRFEVGVGQHLVRFERFPGCGHGVFRDDPERAFAMIREFLGR